MTFNFDCDLRPGSGLGIFELGSSLWNVLDLLRRLQHSFPQVDIKYDDTDASSTTPIILHIRPHLNLLFSGKQQRLHTIVLGKLRLGDPPVTLRYKDTVLSSPNDVLKRVFVSRTFGTDLPVPEDDLRADLRYPGVWFSFEEDGMGDGLKGIQSEDRMHEVKRVIVSQKELEGEHRDVLSEVVECPAMDGDISRCDRQGITLQFHPAGTKSVHIRLGETTAQDLTMDLGPPIRVHYKDDERMTIHSSNPDDNVEPSYFYNYFQHGLDFLLSPTHVVIKIVLHSNIPGSPLFQRYKRCNWEIEAKPEDDEDDTPPRKPFHERFETISHFLSPREPPPSMLLDRTDDEEAMTLPSATTRLHGYDGIILEVSESSQVVAVMLF
ncbi:hypothetical protein FB45DRAFT_976940 [Roridomyces roridus]|uniref:Uncharacterized protein n=1 Tax=Roridomyces roridus TaxID=1738132 RepID=A0AAD7FUQ9_9AGAR|nr:hypothetical protein FB45DRAFT_976940 [Roridomyces roridus]